MLFFAYFHKSASAFWERAAAISFAKNVSPSYFPISYKESVAGFGIKATP